MYFNEDEESDNDAELRLYHPSGITPIKVEVRTWFTLLWMLNIIIQVLLDSMDGHPCVRMSLESIVFDPSKFIHMFLIPHYQKRI